MDNNITKMHSNTTDLYVTCQSLITNKHKEYHYHISDSTKLHYYINAYINCCLVGPTALLNLSILIVLFKSKSVKTMSNIPIAFLAGWDLLTALLSQPIFAVYLLQIVKLKFSCALLIVVSYAAAIIAMTSSLIVVVITTERYLALFHVFFWAGHITRKMLIIPLSLIWVIPSIICIIMFDVMPIVGVSIYTLLTVLAIGWISISYYRMYKLIRKIQMRVMARENAKQSENEMRGKQARLSKFTFAIVVLYLIVNIPYCVAVILLSTVFKGGIYTDVIKWYFATWLMLNSLLNPIVYAWQCPHIGRGLLRLWRVGRVPLARSTTYKDNAEGSRYKTDAV